MSINLSSPVTGSAQTGFTSPTYTMLADSDPENHARQWYVSAVGGTQTGVTTHSVSSPFTIAFWRPKAFKMINWVSGLVGGQVRAVPRNTYKVITRKGVTPAANQSPQVMLITTTVDVPAGAESYDAPNVRAALSLHGGSIAQQSSGFGDTCVVGSL